MVQSLQHLIKVHEPAERVLQVQEEVLVTRQFLDLNIQRLVIDVFISEREMGLLYNYQVLLRLQLIHTYFYQLLVNFNDIVWISNAYEHLGFVCYPVDAVHVLSLWHLHHNFFQAKVIYRVHPRLSSFPQECNSFDILILL